MKKPKDKKAADPTPPRDLFTGIRLPKRSELPRVAVICQKFIQDEAGVSGTDADHFVDFLGEALGIGKTDDFFIRVAVEDDQVVGSIGVVLNPRWDRPGKMAMVLWTVLSHRRSGWGRKLTAAAQAWAKEQGASEIWTSVPLTATASLGYYPAVGFRTAETLFKKGL